MCDLQNATAFLVGGGISKGGGGPSQGPGGSLCGGFLFDYPCVLRRGMDTLNDLSHFVARGPPASNRMCCDLDCSL
jgi:hypothetical protein